MSTTNLGVYSRGYQTHVDLPGVIQFVTFRLNDAIPATLQGYARTTPRSGARWVRANERQFVRALGSCVLRQASCAAIVQETLLEKHQDAYELIAWAIMPNHVHVCFQQFAVLPLGKIVGSWKGKSARLINQTTGGRGTLWYRDYFDRVVRNEAQLWRIVRYIHNNPVKAGLVRHAEDWRFSSAQMEASIVRRWVEMRKIAG